MQSQSVNGTRHGHEETLRYIVATTRTARLASKVNQKLTKMNELRQNRATDVGP